MFEAALRAAGSIQRSTENSGHRAADSAFTSAQVELHLHREESFVHLTKPQFAPSVPRHSPLRQHLSGEKPALESWQGESSAGGAHSQHHTCLDSAISLQLTARQLIYMESVK